MNSHFPFSIKVLLSARFLLKFYLQWHLQRMANHILMESMFRSLLIGPWPKEQVLEADFKHFQA